MRMLSIEKYGNICAVTLLSRVNNGDRFLVMVGAVSVVDNSNCIDCH
jgi:hypothetical protein